METSIGERSALIKPLDGYGVFRSVSCRCKRVVSRLLSRVEIETTPRAIIRGKLNPAISGFFENRSAESTGARIRSPNEFHGER